MQFAANPKNCAFGDLFGIAFGEVDPPESCGTICSLSRHQPRIIYEGWLFPMTKRNIIVVGTSAGGVEALCALSKNLPNDLDASIFVVMHIGSETMLAQILSRCGNLPAVVAKDGKRYERGCIY